MREMNEADEKREEEGELGEDERVGKKRGDRGEVN